jgi:hypothetical protein
LARTISSPTRSEAAARPVPPSRAVPWRVRWFVRAFLVAFAVCGLAGVEAWPLSGFRLFSHLRQEQVAWWQPVVVDHAGVASDFSFSSLPSRDRDFVLTMRAFPSMSGERQARVCRTWLGSMRTHGLEAAELRLYLVERHLVPRSNSHPATPPTRTLRFRCSDGGVSATEDVAR